MASPRFTTPPHVITRRHAITHHPGTTRRHRVITGLVTAVDGLAMAALVMGGPATVAVEGTGMAAVVATMVIAHRPKGQDRVVAVPALAGMAITVAEELAVAPDRADLLAEATSARMATLAEAGMVVPAAVTDKPTGKRRSQERRFCMLTSTPVAIRLAGGSDLTNVTAGKPDCYRCGGVRKIESANTPKGPPTDAFLPTLSRNVHPLPPMECSRCPASASAACDPCRSNAPGPPRQTPGADSN